MTSNRRARDDQRDRSGQNNDTRRVHITARPPRRQVTHQVYTRISGSIPSNYYDGPSAPFIWEHSDDDSSSARRREPSAGISQEQTDSRIEEWMERMNGDGLAISRGQIKDTSYAAAGTHPFTFRSVDPNTMTPSVTGSHYSGESLPSRPTSPVRPPPVMQRPPGQEPVVLRPPGYVPPERRAERERANQVIVSESSERRRRRREERDRDRQRLH
ncbi:hypothetical protein F4805DRAFT_431918 [Annulohypoxylon moriforme]|nr:hypothetical protein F4805DRAFT_431918 [Annulohypoxylon moriforme]